MERCQAFWNKALAKGDVYLGTYEGWCAQAMAVHRPCGHSPARSLARRLRISLHQIFQAL
eukprot:scaffold226219_cov27-Tisochrysis_lutea.AAC.2